jgi:Mg-chelatase subunit ChlD
VGDGPASCPATNLGGCISHPNQSVAKTSADVSRSVAADFIDDALNWIDTAQREHEPSHSNLVVFAKQPAVVADTLAARGLKVVDGTEEFDAADQPVDAIMQSATDIEAALDESLGALSRDRVKRIVLLSDGNATNGAVANVLPRLKSAGVRVFALAAKPYGAGDVWVDGIEVPDRLRSDEPTKIAVRVLSPVKTRAEVSLASGGRTLASKRARLSEGINRVHFDTRMPQPGAVSLTAEVRAEGDTVEHNNRLQISAWVGDKAKVLYVEGKQGTSKYLAGALRKEGLDVDVAGAQRVASLQTLLRYDALILSDVPANQFSPEVMLSVKSYVRDHGGGLVFAGGENTFGERGYSESPMEDVLPVEFKAQEKRKDIALVIAIDRSYSMKGRKMEYAKEAARAALDLLEEQHQFAVVAFDSQPYVAVPMHQVRSKRKAEAQISRIQASGQTNIYPALGIVYRMLRKADARTKHVILLSDGDTHPADFERLLERMRERNIVVSDAGNRRVGRWPQLPRRQRGVDPTNFHRGNQESRWHQSGRRGDSAGGEATFLRASRSRLCRRAAARWPYFGQGARHCGSAAGDSAGGTFIDSLAIRSGQSRTICLGREEPLVGTVARVGGLRKTVGATGTRRNAARRLGTTSQVLAGTRRK